MGIVEFILENIEKKIYHHPCIHYALQGEKRNFILKEVYERAFEKYHDIDNTFTFMYHKDIKSRVDLFKDLLEKENSVDKNWEDLAEKISHTTYQYFVFVEDFDKIMHKIDRKHESLLEENYEVGNKLVAMPNLYLTITATSNQETLATLIKTNSPFWVQNYFRFVQVN